MVYQQYLNIIDEKADEIFAVSDGIWDRAELPWQEYRSMELLSGHQSRVRLRSSRHGHSGGV